MCCLLLGDGVLCWGHGVSGSLEHSGGGHWGSQRSSRVGGGSLVDSCDPLLHVHGVTRGGRGGGSGGGEGGGGEGRSGGGGE